MSKFVINEIHIIRLECSDLCTFKLVTRNKVLRQFGRNEGELTFPLIMIMLMNFPHTQKKPKGTQSLATDAEGYVGC